MVTNTDHVGTHMTYVSKVEALARKWHKQLWRLLLVFSDAVVLGIAFLFAYWLRFEQGFAFRPEVVPNYTYYSTIVRFLIPAYLVLFWLQRLYDYRYLLGGTEEYRRIFNACTIGMMVVMTFSFLVPIFVIARAWLVFGWLFSVVFVIASRVVLRRIAYGLRSRDFFVERTVIIGTNEEAAMLVERCGDCRQSGLDIVGLVEPRVWQSDETQQRYVEGLPVIGGLGMLPSIVEMHRVDKVIIASTAVRREELIHIPASLSAYPDIEMQLSSGMYEFLTTGMVVTTKNSVPLIGVNRLRFDWGERTAKSVLDRLYVLLSLPFLLPVVFTIGAMIRLDSPGPILYKRRVLGLSGKEFLAYKFRSMYVNGDEILDAHPEKKEELERNQKLVDDPRVTKVGAWLRKTSLDELPQLDQRDAGTDEPGWTAHDFAGREPPVREHGHEPAYGEAGDDRNVAGIGQVRPQL